jgi:sigma-B regulation protein RsbU (phosphoserine phosphatase)
MDTKKKFKFGGIRNKLFILIMITAALISIVFSLAIAYQNRMLNTISAEANQKQQQSIAEITDSVMTEDIRDNLERITKLEALSTDEIFRDAEARVTLLARSAARIYGSRSGRMAMYTYAGPNPALDGQLSAQVIFADDVDPSDPEVQSAVGLTANLSDMMLTICRIFNSDNIYVALPEGAFLSVSSNSASWFEPDGSLMSYDARSRFWYKQAVEAGGLVFTDVETDANTGKLSLVCAMPVYGPDNALRAVIGTDLFLDTMQASMEAVKQEGGYYLIVNWEGRVISSSLEDEEFREQVSENAPDLRESKNAELAKFIRDAMNGGTESRLVHLESGAYYMTGEPVKTVGWTLISLLKESVATRSAVMLEEGYSSIAEEASRQYQGKKDHAKLMIISVLGVLLLVLISVALMQGRKIVKPLNTMTKRISGMGEGDIEFKMEDAYRTGDEIEMLADSFARLSRKTVDYVEQVKKATAEKERIGAELDMAAMIQSSELPHTFPAFPGRHEFDLYASMDPAREVGGDFYDYFLIDDDHLCIVIADVSGKGIPGALFMMTTKVILKNCAFMGRNPKEILESANEAVCSNNQAGMFVSVWMGILEISTGKLTAANAGHEYPAVKMGEGGFGLYKDKHGLVIGAMDGVRYTQYELQLRPGDRLFLYTDGVPEATDANNELFGTERMVEALNRDPAAGPQEVIGIVREAVDGFVREAEQFDDMTMVCLEYKGK